jgi:uncharacterized membrane protein
VNIWEWLDSAIDIGGNRDYYELPEDSFVKSVPGIAAIIGTVVFIALLIWAAVSYT